LLRAASSSGLGTGERVLLGLLSGAAFRGQRVPVTEQEVFFSTPGFLQNTQRNTDLHP